MERNETNKYKKKKKTENKFLKNTSPQFHGYMFIYLKYIHLDQKRKKI